MESNHLIGMVHLLPLPGSPGFNEDMDKIYSRALEEARVLEKVGFDGLIIENYNDTPYLNGEAELPQITTMAAISREISSNIDIDIGVNVQFNDYKSEIAIAKTCGCDFVRIEVFSETVLTPSGTMESHASEIIRTNESMEPRSGDVDLFVDVKSKGVSPLLDESIKRVVERSDDNGADAIIVTGSGTGKATPVDYVQKAKKVTDLPVLAGSGLTPKNLAEVMETADGGIVGSSLKKGGKAENKVATERAQELISALN